MNYKGIIEGRFVKRLNRFIAEVELDGEIIKVHVKNTGRCKELFIEGVRVFLEPATNPDRKTKYSLVGLYKGDLLINIDSQVPNRVVYEALLAGEIEEIGPVTFAKREVTYGKSRFDIYYETETAKGFIEVKGVTLENEGMAMFPDAPTERGTKHIKELQAGLEEGYVNYVCMLIQMDGITRFRPHHERDMKFAEAFYEAKEAGVGVLLYNSVVTEDGIRLGRNCDLLDKNY